MAYLENTPCCAFDIIDGIDEDPETVLSDVCHKKYDMDWDKGETDLKQAFIGFTDNVSDNGYGYDLEDYIKNNKLGSVISTRKRRNPNTDNLVKIWIWMPNERNLRAWYKKVCSKKQ